ncbi:MAG: hypothetical protein NkDv07_0172 [Candidatus Improbicoccus devescovinae]|nr:MAG: hypothetical protein NkDv07_0172 [Candidatus Improbicoccus devescovinae]
MCYKNCDEAKNCLIISLSACLAFVCFLLMIMVVLNKKKKKDEKELDNYLENSIQ